LLEELRRLPDPPFLLFTSTNKVYGSLRNVGLRLNGERWEPSDPATLIYGISEKPEPGISQPIRLLERRRRPVLLDYAAHFGLPAVGFA